MIFILSVGEAHAQNKSGNVLIFGSGAQIATYTDTSKPVLRQLFSNSWNYDFLTATSNICDSSTGNLLILCNGARLWDTLGNIIENGDTLMPIKHYKKNSFPIGQTTQCSLILPKGSNGEYYVFITTVSDSLFDVISAPNAIKTPADILQYNVVDMNANGGMGKVIKKNIPLITNTELSWVGMMACRHANGYDWWLLKQTFDSNKVFTYLVTKDTIELKMIQHFNAPTFGYGDGYGQSCFSHDGKKYAFSGGGGFGNINQLYVADFDRCSGELRNLKVSYVPIDSTGSSYHDSIGTKDSVTRGLFFSPNDSFLYVCKSFNIYQYEHNNTDSATAWYLVHRQDTAGEYTLFGQMQRGIDGRIYVGKFSGAKKVNHVIDKPNIKGIGCSFCQFCLDFSAFNGPSTSPSNMPDFNLGVDSSGCVPLNNYELQITNYELEVYPNPSTNKFYIKCKNPNSKKDLFNFVGQLILSTKENEFDVRHLPKGVYYLRVGNLSKKVIVE